MNSVFAKQKGFSLVEISIVLLIMGLLITGSMTMFSTQRDGVMYSESNMRLQQIKNAMLGFLVINKYMPCPDTNDSTAVGYGRENRATNGRCTAVSGSVPFLDLGLSQADATDGKYSPIRYYVNQEANVLVRMQDHESSASYFCNSTCAGLIADQMKPMFDLQTPPTATKLGSGNYNICAKDNSTCTAGSVMSFEDLPIVLVADNIKGAGNCSAQTASEQENCDGDSLFWQGNFNMKDERPFDDYVLGISAYEIKGKMLMNNPKSLRNE